MSQTRSRLIAEIYAYCGEPPDLPLNKSGLPQEFVFQILCENEDEMLRDVSDSSVSRRVLKEEINLADDQVELSPTSVGTAVYARLRTDPDTEISWPVEIVKPSSLLQASRDGVLAITFHDGLQNAELSWKPDSQQILTIWYDRIGDEDKLKADTSEIGGLYDSLLKLRTAAQCRELMKLEIGGILAARLARGEEQWRRHVNRGTQEGVGYKTRVFTPPRFRRSWPFLDRRRFFVP